MNASDELQDLWCSQPTRIAKGEDMLAEVIERTRTFDRRIAVRNALEIAASFLVIVAFAAMAVRAVSGLERLGMAIVAATGVWIAWYVWRKGTGPSAPDRNVDFEAYQRELIKNYDHQIRLLKNVKYWYLAPPYAGIVIAWIGGAARIGWQALSWAHYLNLAIVTAVFAFVWVANEIHGVQYLEKMKREARELAGGAE
jgi:hypothetical protein